MFLVCDNSMVNSHNFLDMFQHSSNNNEFDPSVIKGIFLDLDDTLYDYNKCNDKGNSAALLFLAEKLKLSKDRVQRSFHLGRTSVKKQLHHPEFSVAASHSRLLYLQKTLEDIIGRTHPSLTLEAERIFWDEFISSIEPLPNVHEFIRKAKSKSKKLVVITDMTAQIQLRKLIKLGIDDFIDFIVSSEETGREKPHPLSLHLALDKAKLSSHQVVMVGEDEKKDIKAARAANITPIAIRYRPSDSSILFAENFEHLSDMLKL